MRTNEVLKMATCQYCGKEIINNGEYVKKYCSKECMQKSLSGQAKNRRKRS